MTKPRSGSLEHAMRWYGNDVGRNPIERVQRERDDELIDFVSNNIRIRAHPCVPEGTVVVTLGDRVMVFGVGDPQSSENPT